MAEEVAPLEIKDRVSLELWLRRQPREVAVITAARAALRVLPICWRFAAVAGGPQQFAKWTLSLFRANAVARIAGKYPTRAKGLRAAAATANVAAANAAANAANYAAYAVNVAAANAANAAKPPPPTPPTPPTPPPTTYGPQSPRTSPFCARPAPQRRALPRIPCGASAGCAALAEIDWGGQAL